MKKYIVVHGIDAHGGFGMENDGCDAAENHFGYTHDGELWHDALWIQVDSRFDGEAQDVDSVVIKVGDILELDEVALKYVKQALETRAEDTPLECGGHWGWVWEFKQDDFWDRAPEAPKCPECGKPMDLDRYAFEGDTRIDRVIVTNTHPSTKHWLFYCCYTHVAINSGEPAGDE